MPLVVIGTRPASARATFGAPQAMRMCSPPGRLLVAGLTGLLACSSSQRFEEDLATTDALASAAVKAALDNGGFQAMMNQAAAASYSVAKARLEAGGRTVSAADAQVLERVIRQVLTEVYPRQAWEDVLKTLYTDNLTREELEEVVRFQSTPIGTKLLAIQATVMTGGSALGERLLQSRRDAFTQRLGEELNRALGSGPGR